MMFSSTFQRKGRAILVTLFISEPVGVNYFGRHLTCLVCLLSHPFSPNNTHFNPEVLNFQMIRLISLLTCTDFLSNTIGKHKYDNSDMHCD